MANTIKVSYITTSCFKMDGLKENKFCLMVFITHFLAWCQNLLLGRKKIHYIPND